MTKGTTWGKTEGAKVEITGSGNGTFLKCEELEDVPFTIYDFEFEPGFKDPKREQVRIRLTRDDEEESEENDYTLTTSQYSIMDQMKKSDPDELPYLDCTLYRPFTAPNRWNTWAYAIGPYAAPIKKNGNMQRDLREDNNRQAVQSSPVNRRQMEREVEEKFGSPPVRTPSRTTPKR